MNGEKYLSKRMHQMKRSDARMSAGIWFRVILLLIVLGLGWFTCDQGLKFLQTQPSFHSN